MTMNIPSPGKPLSKKEAAGVLGVSRWRIRTMIKLGQLQPHVCGRRVVIYESEILRFLERRPTRP